MRLSVIALGAVAICLSTFSNSRIAAQESCDIPKVLSDALRGKYPELTVLRINDLPQSDRELFQKEHGQDCAGMTKVDFYGDGAPTWALVLVPSEKNGGSAKLILARKGSRGFEFSALDSANQPTAVVWQAPSGTYSDLESDKTIRAKHQVLVFASYESWAIVYAWMDNHIGKVWLAD